MDQKQEVYNFLKSVNHAVVSTVNTNGFPQAATVGFGVTETLQVIFGTSSLTQKADNIINNNYVSVVINSPDKSVQYEGNAVLLTGDDLIKYTKIFFKKMPSMEKYFELENQIYYLVTPSWIRYIDHPKSPNGVFEIRF